MSNGRALQETIAIPASERNQSALLHLLCMAGYLFAGLGQLVVPIVMWLLNKNKSHFVVGQAREALNFHIGMTVAIWISLWLCWIIIGLIPLVCFIILIIYSAIRAASKASKGEYYRYPMTVRFFS